MPCAAAPLEMTCFNCSGRKGGCKKCKKTGRITIEQCPLKIITPDVWEIMKLAAFFKKGLPPVAGGVLDQANCFVDAADFIFGIENYVKSKMGIIG